MPYPPSGRTGPSLALVRGLLGGVTGLLLLSAAANVAAQTSNPLGVATAPFSTFEADFTRVFVKEGRVDSLSGTFYYTRPGRLYIAVAKPVEQIMLIEDRTTTIYYPARNQAFVLESRNPALLPFAAGFFAALRPDYGLTELGYQLYDEEVRGDTLVSLWQPKQAQAAEGNFRLSRVRGNLVDAVFTPAQEGVIMRTAFRNFVEVNDYRMPSRIVTVELSPEGLTKEQLTLSNLRVDVVFPDVISAFRLPPGVQVERRTW